jgi:hypothetical protein
LAPLLLFAQRLEELLFDYTVDSYKARALNLHTSLLELRSLAVACKRGRLNTGSLIPVIEELREKVEADPVLEPEERKQFVVYCDQVEAERTKPDSLVDTCDALVAEVQGFYWDRLLDVIRAAVRVEGNSQRICALADAFVSEVELQGFDRRFLFYRVIRAFWRSPVASVDVIDGFLQDFQVGESKWQYIFKVSGCFQELSELAGMLDVEILDAPPPLANPKSWATDFLSSEDAFPYFAVVSEVSAKDAVTGRRLAELTLETLADVYRFLVPQHDPEWKPQCLCIDSDDRVQAILKPPLSPIARRVHTSIAESETQAKHLLAVLSGHHFRGNGPYLIYNVLDFHRAAAEAKTYENQLLDLWAAIEGLLPSPDPNSARITHYVATLLPSLTLTYPEKVFEYFQRAIAADKDVALRQVEVLPVGGTLLEKVIAVAVCEDFESERKTLLEALDHHPLLRFRLFELNEKFRSSSRVRRTVEGHRKRIEWHLQRIYSTRNQIVHTAQSLPYTETLVENLRSYVEVLVRALTMVGKQARTPVTIGGAVKLLQVHERAYLRQLSEPKVRCNTGNFKQVIFGATNPLSPFHDRFTV